MNWLKLKAVIESRPHTRDNAWIGRRLKEHKRLTDKYIAEGMSAEEASKKAYEEVTQMPKSKFTKQE